MSFVWQPDRFFKVDSRSLRADRGSLSQPPEWEGSTRLREEPLETLLTLNLERLTGLPMRWVGWSWAMDPSVDVVATDPLGRIHLFEIKKGSVGAQAASQLAYYLLGHVFADRSAYLALVRRGGFSRGSRTD